MRLGLLVLLGLCAATIPLGPVGCGGGKDDDADGDADADADADADGDSDADGDADSDGDGDAEPPTGSLHLTLTADGGDASDDVVSVGVPFPPGLLTDPERLLVRDPSGTEVPSYSSTLATWPADESVRAALVAFRATLGAGETAEWSVDYGFARSADAGPLPANPDGPVAATLTPTWYATSRVIGYQVPAADDTVFTGWEAEIERALAQMDPPWESYGIDCDTTANERTYYDGPHALFQRFIHLGTADAYRRARAEAVWYRDNELDWYDGRRVAVYACVADWDPAVPLDWGVVRRMLGQGMLDDALLTGDPAALEALAGIGEAFRQNLTALTTGREITVRVTERNMAWPMMGLASAYAVDHSPELLEALAMLVDMTLDWQAESDSGAFEHDISRPDPDECGDGPRGGSPFMTSLLVDALMDAWQMTGDDAIGPAVVRVASWLRDDAITSDGVAFQYLWGCNDVDYDDSSTADLNLLISYVFAAAYAASGDAAWLDFGDGIAHGGIDAMYAGRPKQWSQSTRTFLKYMGTRALDRAP